MDANETLITLAQVKTQRKQAELEVQRLKNRLNNWKKQEKAAAKNAERMKNLSVKLSKFRDDKVEEQFKKQERQRKNSQDLIWKNEENKKKNLESDAFKEENIRKIVQDRKREYWAYKKWINEAEGVMAQEQLRRSEENVKRKEVIDEHRRRVAVLRDIELQERAKNTREMWRDRVDRERWLYSSKMSEKELMFNIDLNIIELMQSHQL